jgi:hypothetical protein
MSEGPVNFGKPLFIIVLVGVIGGGYYAYNHWPAHYDGAGYAVDFPHKWVITPTTDTEVPKVKATGPLLDENTGFGWVTVNVHGTIIWPDYVIQRIPAPDWQEVIEIDYKKSVIFTCNDGDNRIIGVGMERGDAVVICVLGCPKPFFDQNRAVMEKAVRSLRCQR